MKIITGSTGTAHITSNNDGEFNQGIFGDGLVVLNNGNKLAAQIKDVNTITIKDGDLIFQGRHALIEPNTTEDVTIQTGAVGKKRIDLIVAHYQLNESTGYESIALKVIKGTESTGNPTEPSYATGNIRTGSLVAEIPLYKVNLNGINIDSVVACFSPINSVVGSLNNKINYSDIVDNGETADSNKPLSANYGKTLKDYVDGINGQVGVNSGNITSLQTAVGTNTSNISALQNKINLNSYNWDIAADTEDYFFGALGVYILAWLQVGQSAFFSGSWSGHNYMGGFATKTGESSYFGFVNFKNGRVYAFDETERGAL